MTQAATSLVWLDMEMTGLDPERERIIELAIVVTDESLATISESPVWVVHQDNACLEAMDEWSADDKIKVIIAVGEAGYKFDLGKDAPDQFDIDLYELDSLKDLAEQFVEEGLYGEIPKALQYYIDYEAIAHDLGMDYSEIRIDGTNYIYRCG